jgi:hypothetical protein
MFSHLFSGVPLGRIGRASALGLPATFHDAVDSRLSHGAGAHEFVRITEIILLHLSFNYVRIGVWGGRALQREGSG